MGLYDNIKDVASIIQKADNIELYQKLLDISAQALDLQNENQKLRTENAELKKLEELEGKIVRNKLPYFYLEGEPDIHYCAICWGKDKRLIQLKYEEHVDYDYYCCALCKNQFSKY